MAWRRLTVSMRLVVVACVAGIALSALAASMTVAQENPLPPRSTPTPQAHGDGGPGAPVGAYIELSVVPGAPGLWAVVQWQDSAGAWHDVEGWQGPLGAAGAMYWWVAARDFGTGPFRWHVASGPGSATVADSAPFQLPTRHGETNHVALAIQ